MTNIKKHWKKNQSDLKQTNQQRLREERKRIRKQENTKRIKEGLEPLPEDPVQEEEELKRIEQEKKAEEERLEKEKREEEERLEKEKKAEEERLEKEKREEEEKIEQEKKAEKERLEKEKKEEEAKIEQEKKAEDERIEKERKEAEEQQKRKQEEEKQKRKEEERLRKEEEQRIKEEEARLSKEEALKRKQEREERVARMNNLTAALQTKKIGLLKAAIEDIKKHNDEENRDVKPHFSYAQGLLKVLEYKARLKKDMQNYKQKADINALEKTVKDIDDEEMPAVLLEEIAKPLEKARQTIEKDKKLNRKIVHKLNVDAKSLMELRGYNSPDPLIHKTVQSMLLLVGIYEKRTRKWSRCQPLLSKLDRLTSINIATIEPEIAARAGELLNQMDRREIAQMSAVAIAFYDWSVQTVETVKSLLDSDANFKPASIKRQRQLLHVSKEEDADWDWEDKGTRKKRP